MARTVCTIAITEATDKRKRKPGRPPADIGPNGKPRKTSEYPRLVISIRPETKALLQRLSREMGRPMWLIVDESVWARSGRRQAAKFL